MTITTPSISMALAATWTGQRADRARSIVVALAAATVCVIALGAVSVWLSSERINERAMARSFAYTDDPASAVYERRTNYDEAPDGTGILVADWRLNNGAEPLPGIPADATGWWVSPRLAETIDAYPPLELSYPDSSVIGLDGVARADELVAFNMSPDPDVEFNELLTSTPTGYYGEAAELDLLPIVLVTIALIGVPGASLLAAAAGINSPRRERTAQLLATIGAPRRSIRRYTQLTGALAALPGIAIAAIGWTMIAPQLTSVPLVGRAVLAGDLAIHPLAAGGVAAAIVIVAATVSSVAIRPIRETSPSAIPVIRRRLRLPSASWGVFGLSTCMLATVLDGGIRPRLFLLGTVCLIAAAPNTLRALLHLGGTALATHAPNAPVAVIAGRTMAANSRRLTRPLVALMAILVVLPVTLSWVAVARNLDPPRLPNGAATFTMAGPDAADIATRLHETSGTAITSITTTNGTPSASIVGCDQLAGLFGGITCAPTVDFNTNSVGATPPLPITTAVTTSVVDPNADIHIVYSLDAATTEEDLRTLAADAANLRLTVPDQRTESPLVAWILGAAVITLNTTGLGLLIALISRSAHNARSRTRLAALGTPAPTLRRLAGLEAALTTTIAATIALVAGLFVNYVFIRIEPTATVAALQLGIAVGAVAVIITLSSIAAATAIGDPISNWTEHNHTGW